MSNFGRVARVVVGTSLRTAPGRGAQLEVDTDGERGLRVAFRVAKNPRATDPNTCQVTLYNLAETKRSLFDPRSHPHVPLTLEAGYPGLVGALFSGSTARIEHRRERTGWATVLSSTDGETANAVKASKSFKPGAKAASISDYLLGAIAEGAGIDVTQARARLAQGDVRTLSKEFFKGAVIEGRAMDVLERMLAEDGLELSIQDGEAQILRSDETVRDIVILSDETGLIESPVVAHDKQLRGAYTVKGKAQLNPRIVPGSLIRLSSRVASGDFKIVNTTAQGDTHGADWWVEFEGRAIT